MSTEKTAISCVLPKTCNKRVITSLQGILVPPFNTGDQKLEKLLIYFLHYAPDIESEHSRKINLSRHAQLFSEMLQGRHFQYQKMCAKRETFDKNLIKGHFNGEALCLKCKRYICLKKDKEKNQPGETDFDCFLRHIRNSIAHGRFYFSHAGNKVFLVFEDKNKRGKLTARIICIRADLECWKEILERKENYQ